MQNNKILTNLEQDISKRHTVLPMVCSNDMDTLLCPWGIPDTRQFIKNK